MLALNSQYVLLMSFAPGDSFGCFFFSVCVKWFYRNSIRFDVINLCLTSRGIEITINIQMHSFAQQTASLHYNILWLIRCMKFIPSACWAVLFTFHRNTCGRLFALRECVVSNHGKFKSTLFELFSTVPRVQHTVQHCTTGVCVCVCWFFVLKMLQLTDLKLIPHINCLSNE